MTGINIGDVGTATSTAAAATINHTEGLITTEALTTASGSDYTFTLTNNAVYANSIVLWAPYLADATKHGLPVVRSVANTAGQSVVVVRNQDGTNAFNSVLTLAFVVL